MALLVVRRSSFHTALAQVNLKLVEKGKRRIYPEQAKHLPKAQVNQISIKKDKSSLLPI